MPTPDSFTNHVDAPPTTGLGRIVSSVVDAGRDILAKRRQAAAEKESLGLAEQCQQLLSHRGEASGLALASEITAAYMALDQEHRLGFFLALATQFEVNSAEILTAAENYKATPNHDSLAAISKAAEAPRIRLFRRINMAPDGTAVLVKMRGHLLPLLKSQPELKPVDADLKHQFVSWFNKGFLEMRRIDWNSPALVLEKIIDYEAVHEIGGWDDLRSRLGEDRLCFAFFHPAMPDDPLVFVEIALTKGVSDSIAPLLELDRSEQQAANFDTVVFYSISNCHPGLAGVSFGNFLIKQVVEETRKEFEQVKTFVTLSPVPGFKRWLDKTNLRGLVDESLIDKVKKPLSEVVEIEVRDALLKLCAHYLVNEKSGDLAKDPVARFHLGNGARLHRINWAADLSVKGKEQSAGIMVNYLYDLKKIEVNHDAYFDQGEISVSRTVSKLL
jgi:malonyl-CoA decarboxylase